MRACGGGRGSGRCSFGFPLAIVKFLLGEGLSQDAGLASQALCNLQDTFTLMTSLRSFCVLSEVDGVASPIDGWEN